MNEIGNEVRSDIINELSDVLTRTGIMHRLFSRSKSIASIKHKIANAAKPYTENGKKIQDVIGIRIVCYFLHDVRTLCGILKNGAMSDCYNSISDSEKEYRSNYLQLQDSKYSDVKIPPYAEVFQPQRLNLIFTMNKRRAELLDKELEQQEGDPSWTNLIDHTYEVQLRSVLSEGWHEVEHDLRYKCKNSGWSYCESESRSLNGIYAALESHEKAMELMFEEIAHKNYLNSDWQAMLRNHLRLSIDLYQPLSNEIKEVFAKHKNIAKFCIRFEREMIIEKLANTKISFPLKYTNIVFLMNRLRVDGPFDELLSIEPKIIKDKLDKICIK